MRPVTLNIVQCIYGCFARKRCCLWASRFGVDQCFVFCLPCVIQSVTNSMRAVVQRVLRGSVEVG